MAISEVLQFVGKVLYTGILGSLIVLLGSEVWRVWFDRTLVLAPFSYLRDGLESRESGLGFTQLVSRDLLRLRDLYSSKAASSGHAIPSTDQLGAGASLDIPEAGADALSDLELEAYGIPVSQLLRRVSRWIHPPYEIAGSVSERADKYDLYAEVRGGAPSSHWYLLRYTDRSELSSSIACRILRHLAAKRTPSLFGSEADGTLVEDREFCLFLAGLEHYHAYVQRLGESPSDSTAALNSAGEVVEKLIATSPRFVFSHKLAAYVLRERGALDSALAQVDLYEAGLARAKLSDATAQELRVAITTRMPTSTTVASKRGVRRRESVRPLHPGLSLGDLTTGAGSLGCIVKDAAGIRYALTVDHVLPGGVGQIAIQPATFDGGTVADRIGVVSQVISPVPGAANSVAAALVRLDDTVEATNRIPSIGEISGVVDGNELDVSTAVKLVGRSGVAEGRVTAIEASVKVSVSVGEVVLDNMVTTTRISQPGDSGAPVLTNDRQLVGFIFAGSRDETIVMLAKPILQAFGVELLRMD